MPTLSTNDTRPEISSDNIAYSTVLPLVVFTGGLCKGCVITFSQFIMNLMSMWHKMTDDKLPVSGIMGNIWREGNIMVVIHSVHYGPLLDITPLTSVLAQFLSTFMMVWAVARQNVLFFPSQQQGTLPHP